MLRSNEALGAEQEVPSEGRAATGMLLAMRASGRLWWLLGGGRGVADGGRQHVSRGPLLSWGGCDAFLGVSPTRGDCHGHTD